MCKESTLGYTCPGCGMRTYYFKEHVPHCVKLQIVKLNERKAAYVDA